MELKQLMTNFPKSGKVGWIGLRNERSTPLKEVESVSITIENGLEGDHYKGTNKKR